MHFAILFVVVVIVNSCQGRLKKIYYHNVKKLSQLYFTNLILVWCVFVWSIFCEISAILDIFVDDWQFSGKLLIFWYFQFKANLKQDLKLFEKTNKKTVSHPGEDISGNFQGRNVKKH